MPDFSSRAMVTELMDDPGIAREELRGALGELERINRSTNGYAPSLAGIRRLLPANCRSFTLLDVGTGGGDFPRHVTRWAQRRGIEIEVKGIDVSEIAIEYAMERSRTFDNISFECVNLFEVPNEPHFDVVHASLVLHHFNGDSAAEALKKMVSLGRWGVVLNDLHRHPLAYYAIKASTRFVWKNRLIQNDGPLSVLRAFRRREIERLVSEIGLPAPELRWRWAFRWQVVIPRRGER